MTFEFKGNIPDASGKKQLQEPSYLLGFVESFLNPQWSTATG